MIDPVSTNDQPAAATAEGGQAPAGPTEEQIAASMGEIVMQIIATDLVWDAIQENEE